MKKVLSLYFLLLFTVSHSQNLMWARQLGGNNSVVYPMAVATDQLGNVFVTGNFVGFADFDPGPGTRYLSSAFPTNSNPMYYDIFVSKFNLSGTHQWSFGLIKSGGTGNCSGEAICTDAAGNTYITGFFSGSVNFDTGLSTYSVLTSAGGTDIFVLKLDPNGNFMWVVQMGGTGNEAGSSIAVDPLGHVYTTGNFSGLSDFDPGAGTYTLSSSGGLDIFICRLSASGNFQWAKGMGSISSDQGNTLVLDAFANVCVGGIFYGTVDFDPSASTSTLASVIGTTDGFFMKVDSSGNFLWAKQLAGTGLDRINAMALDGLGNMYLTGSFNGVTDFDAGPSTFTINTYGSSDIYVSKYDASGNFGWISRMGGPSGEEALGICVGASGDIYTTGAFFTICDFDPGAGSYTLSPTNASFDVFLSRLNSTGGFVAAKRIGGTGLERGEKICTDVFGDIIFVGPFLYGTGIDFDPSPGTYTFASIGDDGYITKFSDCTTPATLTAVSSSTDICSGQSFTIAANGVSSSTVYPGLTTGNNQIITPTVNTVYTMIGINSSNCKGAATFSINVNPNPTITVMSSGSLICAGQTTTLDADGAATYTWSTASNSSSITISPTVSTTYSVVGTSSLGCSNLGTYTQSVNPSPTVMVVSTGTSLCAGQTATLSANGAATYTWNTASTASSIFINPSITTTYSVIGTNSLGCSNVQTYTQVVNPNPTVTIQSTNNLLCAGQTTTLTASGASTYTWSTTSNSSSITVVPTVNTTYTVTGTSSLGCSNFSTYTQSVNPSPSVTVISTGSALCAGQTATLSASGASNYTWSTASNSSSIVASPITTTTYTVTGTNSLGCLHVQTFVQTVNPNPTITVLSTKSVICTGQTATLSAAGASNYTWSTNSNASTITVSPVVTTIYTVTGTGSLGCSQIRTFTQSVSGCTGIEEFRGTVRDLILISPNPNSGSFVVSSETDLDVLLMDEAGRLVCNIHLDTANGRRSSISNLPNGLYFIIGNTDTGVIRQKIIVAQ